ncbi:NAD-dependent dihydropyrimidine dehydrogenase subunit PreA [bacterium]|nr:NAD-dependent dihydropyrimidine dehydrogenase subunit PreA [bacterium]
MKDLSITVCGVKFPNPFLLSSSVVSNTAEMVARAFDAGFGGVSFKGIGGPSVEIINPAPRMHSYNLGSKKLVGLQNVEQTTDRPLEDNIQDVKWLKKHYPNNPVMVNIMGFNKEEWKYLAQVFEDAGADMLELNFSCPHMSVEGSGMKVGQAFKLVGDFTDIVKRNVKIPVFAKLTSNVTDITEPAMYAKEAGADGITAVNTVRAITNIDINNFVPCPNIFGKGALSGYSGPGIKPISLKCIVELAKKEELGLPLAGCGGIETWVDVVEFLLGGASLVQMTTSIVKYGHRLAEDLVEGLSFYMEDKGFNKVEDIVGKALPNFYETKDFDLSRQGAAQFDLDRCIGCGVCYIACQDAGGQCIEWDSKKRRPIPDEEKCYSCMICSFVCPIDNPPLITFKEIKGKKIYTPPPSKL